MKIRAILFIALSIVFTVGCCFLLAGCIRSYSDFGGGYEELQYQVLTFEGYENVEGVRGSTSYAIYFREYSKPFAISSITQKEVNKSALYRLEKNDRVSVYFQNDSSEKYDFSICELKLGATTILSLQDYQEANQSNQRAGIIVCSIMVALGLLLVFISVRFFVKLGKKYESELGELKIEYTKDGNVIRIYNKPSVCSLEINGTVVGRYFGYVAAPFCLSGMVLDKNGQEISVKAAMGSLYIRLYYGNEQVGKKFMGLG